MHIMHSVAVVKRASSEHSFLAAERLAAILAITALATLSLSSLVFEITNPLRFKHSRTSWDLVLKLARKHLKAKLENKLIWHNKQRFHKFKWQNILLTLQTTS